MDFMARSAWMAPCRIFQGVTSCIILYMVTPGLHPAVPTLLAEASGNPPLMRQTPGSCRDLFQLEPYNCAGGIGVIGVTGVAGVMGVNGCAGDMPGTRGEKANPATHFRCRISPSPLGLPVRQTLQRRSGLQLLEHGLQSDDLPHAELADSN